MRLGSRESCGPAQEASLTSPALHASRYSRPNAEVSSLLFAIFRRKFEGFKSVEGKEKREKTVDFMESVCFASFLAFTPKRSSIP